MDSTGRGRGDSVVGMEGECDRLDEAVYNIISSDARIAPGLVGQGWYGILDNFFLNFRQFSPTL